MEEELLKLGLSESEIEVYLTLLELGHSTVGQIQKKTKLYRSAIYEALHRLQQKGIVAYALAGKKRYFAAADPSTLLDFLDTKESELKKQRSSIEKLLPTLRLKKEVAKQEQGSFVFTGVRGVRAFLDLLISEGKKNDIIYAFGIPKEMRTLYGGYFKEYHRKRIARGIKTKLIFSHDAYQTPYEEPKQLIEMRKFSKDQSFPAEIAILNDLVGIVMPSENPIAFVIRNQKVAESFLGYFELLWKHATA